MGPKWGQPRHTADIIMTKVKTNVKEKSGGGSPPAAAKPSTLVDAVEDKPKGFGIKSYLHQFYQSPTAEDIEAAGAW